MSFLRRWRIWIPVLTLVGIPVGFLVDRAFGPKPNELVIQPAPAKQIPPLELPPRQRSLAGRVVDPSDAPLADALVWLRAGNAPHFAYTDEKGAFRIDAIEEPPWHATVLAQGFAPMVRDLEESPESTIFRMDAPLGAAPSLPRIARARIAGEVKSRLPSSLAGDEVVLIPTADPETLGAPVPRRASVGADGKFAFEDLILGEYRIEVRPAWARGGSWPDLLRALDAPSGRAVDLAAAGAPSSLALDLEVGDLEGRLAGLEGEAIEGGLVLASAAGDSSRVWPPETSRADGTFSVRGLPAGAYALSIRAGAAIVQKDVLVRAGEATAVELEPLDVRRSR